VVGANDMKVNELTGKKDLFGFQAGISSGEGKNVVAVRVIGPVCERWFYSPAYFLYISQ